MEEVVKVLVRRAATPLHQSFIKSKDAGVLVHARSLLADWGRCSYLGEPCTVQYKLGLQSDRRTSAIQIVWHKPADTFDDDEIIYQRGG